MTATMETQLTEEKTLSTAEQGIDAEYLLADRGYDTDNVIEQADSAKMEAVIPPKKNRKNQRRYDKNIYENRYQVENRFLKLKGWRGIATRYAKTTSSYKASVQICCFLCGLTFYDDTV